MDEENAWELSKENIQPLKGGRRMGTLLAALKKGSDSSPVFLEKQEYELKLRTDIDNIDLWYNYVFWTEQNYPCNLMHVHHLLERCVKHFRDTPCVRHSEKYLKLWLKLASMLSDPTEVFNYLHCQDVGTEHCLFYRAWAEHCEVVGAWRKADEIYQLGIKTCNLGLETLRKAYLDFQQRFVRALQSSGSDICPIVDAEEQRVALGTLNLVKANKPSSNRAAVKFPNEALLGVHEKFRVGSQSNGAKSAFKIFGDDPDDSRPAIPQSKNEFKDVPLASTIHAENKQRLECMGKVTLHLQPPAKTENNFKIFADLDDVQVARSKTVVLSERRPLTARKVAKEVHEMIFFEESSVPSCGNQVYKYAKCLTDSGEYEVSFEELKAQHERYSLTSQKHSEFTKPKRVMHFVGSGLGDGTSEEPAALSWD